MDTKLTLIRSNIGSAMDLEILHLNKLYARYYKEVWHDTCGPTFSQSLSCIGYARSTLSRGKGGA